MENAERGGIIAHIVICWIYTILEAVVDAYVVLAGGGTKGAVHAGCIAAAEDKGIRIHGFGGTSAGSIVALLGSLRYSADEIKSILLDLDFNELLDDGGTRLNDALTPFENCTKPVQLLRSARRICAALQQHGLYNGQALWRFLTEKIAAKIDDPTKSPDTLTFADFARLGCLPLRVVATDLSTMRAVVFAEDSPGLNKPVVASVVASATFPFVFQPVLMDELVLVDGGLSSNLPAFLFEQEYRQTRIRTLAFDIVSSDKAENISTPGNVCAFAKSMFGSALGASDVLLRDATPGVSYFPISAPGGIGTLQFSMPLKDRQFCFQQGYAEAASKLERHEPIAMARDHGVTLQKRLIQQYGPVKWFAPILRAVIDQVADESADAMDPDQMRAHVMIRTGRQKQDGLYTRMVVYSLGMESDPDVDFEIGEAAGCSGRAWQTKLVAFADLDEARQAPNQWGMSPEEHNKVPQRIKTMISVPIIGNARSEKQPEYPIGTLSVDSELVLADTGWVVNAETVNPEVNDLMLAWANVVAAILS